MIFLYCLKRGSSPEANPTRGVSQYLPPSTFRRLAELSWTNFVMALSINFSGSFANVILSFVPILFLLGCEIRSFSKLLIPYAKNGFKRQRAPSLLGRKRSPKRKLKVQTMKTQWIIAAKCPQEEGMRLKELTNGPKPKMFSPCYTICFLKPRVPPEMIGAEEKNRERIKGPSLYSGLLRFLA